MPSRSALVAPLFGALFMPAVALAQADKPLPYGMVRVGDEFKQTIATISELQNGDRACTMIMRDSRGKEFTELGSFDVCGLHIIGKRVRLTYKMEEVMAQSCQGNPRCTRKDVVPLVIDARPIRQ